MTTPMTLVVGDPANNQLGRVQSVHRTALEAGYRPRVLTTVRGTTTWAPLRGSDVDRVLERIDPRHLPAALAAGTGPVVVVKPRWDSLGALLSATGRAPLRVPVVVDVDDPDLEELRADVHLQFRTSPGRAAVRWRRYLRMRAAVQAHTCTVSNPVLHRTYGGLLLPHARPDRGPGLPHTTQQPTVAFIGSPKPHKGLDLLRSAVARLAHLGYRLVVTAEPLGPVPPWERWTGPLDEASSMELLRTSDVVALPSLDRGWGRAQLPMKLVDAMMAGRAVVSSRIEPMSWALAGSGVLVAPGSETELVDALVAVGDPHERQRLGDRARQLALGSFTPAALAPTLLQAVEEARRRLG